MHTTTCAWQKHLEGLASREILKSNYPYNVAALDTLAEACQQFQQLNILSVKHWQHHFKNAFSTDQKLMTVEDAMCLKMHACKLAVSHPSSLGCLCIEDYANPDQVFAPRNTTAAWHAAATLFGSGSPWNISAGGTDVSHLPLDRPKVLMVWQCAGFVESNNARDLLVCLNNLSSSSYFEKVVKTSRIAAEFL